MKLNRLFLYLVLVLGGGVLGFAADEYLRNRASEEAAKAGLLAAGECLRKNDAVCAMTYAQLALNNAPYAYDAYEAIGDVYVRLNVPSAARVTYERAIERLDSGGQDALLVPKGMVSVEDASELVQRKLSALPSMATEPQQTP